MAQREFADGTKVLRVAKRPDGNLDVKIRDDAGTRWLVLSEDEYQWRRPRLAFQGEQKNVEQRKKPF